MTENPNRQPKGTPTGGQFAAKQQTEAETTLAVPAGSPALYGSLGEAFARHQADGRGGWALVNRTLADVGVRNTNDDPVTAGMVARAAGFDVVDWGVTTVADSQGEERTITPGLLDDEAVAVYEDGPQSLALAAAIAHEKDWDVLVTYATDEDADETRIFDAQAIAPADAGAPLVTADGLSDTYPSAGTEWVDSTRYDVEVVPRPSRSDMVNHLVADWTNAPVHGPLAQTFVGPVLAKAAREREQQVAAEVAAAKPGDRLYDENFEPFTVGESGARIYENTGDDR